MGGAATGFPDGVILVILAGDDGGRGTETAVACKSGGNCVCIASIMVCVRPLCEGVDALTAMGSSCAGAAEAPEIRVDTDAVGTGKPSSTADASVPFRMDDFGDHLNET